MAADNAAHIVPGPRGMQLLKTVIALRRDPLVGFLQVIRDYGDVAYFPLRHRSFYLFAHPRDIARVLQENHQNYDKRTRTFAKIRLLMGEGLITSDGDVWRRHRRLVQPAFHHQEIAGLASVITGLTADTLPRWRGTPRDQPIDIAKQMTDLTLRIVGRALFGQEVGSDRGSVGAAISFALEYTARRAEGFFDPGDLPIPARRRFRRALAQLDELVFRLIRERREQRTGQHDLLSLLLNARDESGEHLNDSELRDQVLTLLLAGHETTATALTWTCYLIAKHPQVQERLGAEVTAALGGRIPVYADLASLSYTHLVLQEAMRLFPPVWLLERRATEEDVVGGYRIPAGATLALSQYITHRHPDFWKDPERFDPERFRPEQSAGRPRYAYFPFGGGPRGCVGAGFAMMEAQLILAMIVQAYRLEVAPGQEVVPKGGVTLRPRRAVYLSVRSVED